MKYVCLLLTLVLSMATTHNLKAANPSVGFGDKNMLTSTRLAAMQASHSILVKKYDYAAALADSDRCGKYKRIRTAGIVLLSVGGVTLGGGIAMTHIGIRAAIYDELDTYTKVNLIAGGVVCSVLGVGMLAAGTALTISGSVKYRKYCGTDATGSLRHFYISPSASGLGLAARF